ncbi:MAG TPA: ATP-dependent protease ATPase subunit HslU, partial [Planctomycetota bacterium]|nr:ATP-dependent protease ATPase subunit HslU [Planctomycetota bacterium]
TPRKIVQALDQYIVGQSDAKRAVAVAVRNRWRRSRVEPGLREEVKPKNIMLIGPTGVGKTEIARRIATLVNAPFLKVEATKYTEVGYVGKNVDSMIRDLVEISMRMVKSEELERVQPKAEKAAEEKLLDLLLPGSEAPTPPEGEDKKETRAKLREKLRKGELEAREVEVQVEERSMPFMQLFSEAGMEEMGLDMGNLFGAPARKFTRKVKVSDARQILTTQQADRLVDRDHVNREGLLRAQENGIIFVDEIDKIVASAGQRSGPDVSREGVQRDLLPIVEGSTVNTRYGPVRTDHILFFAAGAFSHTKPSDLMPELQGRFPLRAELKSLTRDDFVRILTQPKNALTLQASAMLATEGVEIEFTADGVGEMADLAAEINTAAQDIGARRLHTVIEKVLEEISFQAPDIAPCRIPIDAKYVRDKIKPILETQDLKRYIL